MLRICISGLGRTGIQIAKYLLPLKDSILVSVLCSPGSSKSGQDLGRYLGGENIGVPIIPSDQIEQCIFSTRPDVVIDFSTPAAAVKNTEIFSGLGVNIVMGTTGFNQVQEKKLRSLIQKNKSGLIFAPNITRGVNTLMLLAKLASKVLGDYDMEIIEMHHKNKHDIPSGTALKIADAVADSREPVSMMNQSDIPISSVRAGGIIGCHKVMLVGEYDMIEISHQTFSRDAFAEGAVYAAKFIQNKTGIYQMKDAFNYDEAISDLLKQTAMIQEA